jgi:fructose-bisphosphate aldolase class I
VRSPRRINRPDAAGVECTTESRRAYRALLLATPGVGEYLSGVILFEETLGQKTEEGMPLPQAAERQGIVPGIKVDKGKVERCERTGGK